MNDIETSRLGIPIREVGECIGGGLRTAPDPDSVKVEADGTKTGACMVCGQRFALEDGIGIPRHQRPSGQNSGVA